MAELQLNEKCFFISPIGEEGSDVRFRSDTVRDLILKPALVPGIVEAVERADEHTNPGEITPAMVASIAEAKLVVADLTGANPNVYYELAIAHAFGRPTIHIRHVGEALPFDIKDIRVFDYGLDLAGGIQARGAVLSAAETLLADPGRARTPVSGGVTLLTASQSTDPEERMTADLARRLGNLEAAIDRLGRNLGQVNGELAHAEDRLRVAQQRRVELIAERRALKSTWAAASGRDLPSREMQQLDHDVNFIDAALAAADADVQAAESAVQSVLYSMHQHPSRLAAARRSSEREDENPHGLRRE